ncbi:ubiquitin-associated domain-containing protein 1 isoform X2 [Lethenteron reissneri]|uniref:ubiquitin-associated domain-containing protein 1 isoform X2 n=1 Tax=Lethenteron reissneri TaxID=7753 RepID=UPI002AB73A52|nr:ubiquitin-associated domain-containing protein 1 isoform X2 [Lethenteron reissneri]
MFVEEEKIFAAQALLLRLTVLAADGAEWRGEAAEAAPLRELKERALPQCVPGAAEDPKAASHYKLVHVGSVRSLADSRTAAQEGLQDQDVLLLIRRRPPPPLPKMTDVASEEKRKAEQKAPDRDAIVQATAGVRARNASRTTTAPPNIRDFHTDLRKILVSLIDVAQKLLALNPEAVDLFRTANAMLDEDVEAERPPEVEGALTQLLEMGFPEGRASVALHSNDMSVTRAMEWLIEHEHDSTAATSTATTSTTTTIATSTTTAPAITGPAAATASWLPRPPAAPPATSPAAPRSPRGGAQGEVATPDDLTEVFRRIRRRREFRPDPMLWAVRGRRWRRCWRWASRRRTLWRRCESTATTRRPLASGCWGSALAPPPRAGREACPPAARCSRPSWRTPWCSWDSPGPRTCSRSRTCWRTR